MQQFEVLKKHYSKNLLNVWEIVSKSQLCPWIVLHDSLQSDGLSQGFSLCGSAKIDGIFSCILITGDVVLSRVMCI